VGLRSFSDSNFLSSALRKADHQVAGRDDMLLFRGSCKCIIMMKTSSYIFRQSKGMEKHAEDRRAILAEAQLVKERLTATPPSVEKADDTTKIR